MLTLSGLGLSTVGFLQPWFLIGLLALPILWWLLRATPPAPRTERFPAIRVLLGLDDKERTPARTPWWLLLLRVLATGLLLLAFAEPLLNPKERLAGTKPVLLIMDGGWASANDWTARREAALDTIDQARSLSRPLAFLHLGAEDAGATPLAFTDPDQVRDTVAALEPAPWAPMLSIPLSILDAEESFDTVYLHDGLERSGAEALMEALAERGDVRMIGPARLAYGLGPTRITGGAMIASAIRAEAGDEEQVTIGAFGRRPGAEERLLLESTARFEDGALVAEAEIDLPLELRNDLTRLQVLEEQHPGSIQLLDDRYRRRQIALISGERVSEAHQLLSSLHYLRAALDPHAAYQEMSLEEALDTAIDAIVLADIGRMNEESREALTEWVDGGGLLIRFAGPQMAAAADERSRQRRNTEPDPLLPVALRGGGRELGGALSWSTPQALRPFPEGSPFEGLTVPEEATVSRQVLAQPDPELSDKVWALLADGTPLVTADDLGDGKVVLFHVSANPTWSSLPLSGLFVEMTARLVSVAPSLAVGNAVLAEDSSAWRPEALLDGYGLLRRTVSDAAPVEGRRLADGVAPGVAPGYYDGSEAALALNVLRSGDTLAPRQEPPGGVVTETLAATAETPLKPALLGAATMLFLIDILAALLVAGRLRPSVVRGGARAAGLVLAVMAAGSLPSPGVAQTVPEELRVDPAEQRASLETVLAYVITGDRVVDEASEAGLTGLSSVLFRRTAIEPGEPAGVNLETDDIALFPMLYWPMTPSQPALSDDAVRRLNAFMRTGGMMVVDTRDAHQSIGSAEGPNARHLRRLLGRLDLPPLAPAPSDHTLTRSFYLLQAFPGRWDGAPVWVEGRTTGVASGTNANDGVSPIVIGAHDWAAAWAIDDDGRARFPMRSERQREIAFRFGVNLAMYVFTGNYKHDQVHLPAIVERLGN